MIQRDQPPDELAELIKTRQSENPFSATEEVTRLAGQEAGPDAQRIYGLTRIELERLKQEVASCDSYATYSKFVEVAVSLYLMSGGQALEEFAGFLNLVISSIFERGALTALLEFLTELKQQRARLDERAQKTAEELIGNLLNDERLKQLAANINNAPQIGLQDFLKVLPLLGDKPLEAIIRIYPLLDAGPLRNSLKSLLVAKLSNQLALLAPLLLNPQVQIATEAVEIIESVGTPDGKEMILKLFEHEDVSRRKLAFWALTKIELHRSSLYRKALGDLDESMRILAMRTAIKRRDSLAFPAISEFIKQESFKTRHEAERKWAFAAAAMAGEKHAIPLLAGFFETKQLLKRQWVLEHRMWAVGALALLSKNHAEAMNIVRRGSLDPEQNVSQYCAKLLHNPVLMAQELQQQQKASGEDN
jgi:hypothetical protein